ncbi:malic enzyme-like NAD(P)-binding protein [Streptomyces sp. NPDC001020]
MGTSTAHGAFTEEIVRALAAGVERPLLLPLSNPTSRIEVMPSDAVLWSEGRALMAADQRVPAVRGGPTARPVRPQQFLQAGAVLLHERLQALDVPLAFLGAHRAQSDVQELPVRPVALARCGQGPREAFRGRQDVLRVQLRSRAGSSSGASCGAGEASC